ncbi:hypothetical protein SAMN05216386_1164 [Nitrosospira briensis]|uniref:Uncharacterized protein n=1 Tax=Nitrosospira briensis TaxID=35799 RepID=A0A1I5A1D0_9PROT|nr:hypothetical protein SAMN05216386_1164 [Nitrosospira briensis]
MEAPARCDLYPQAQRPALESFQDWLRIAFTRLFQLHSEPELAPLSFPRLSKAHDASHHEFISRDNIHNPFGGSPYPSRKVSAKSKGSPPALSRQGAFARYFRLDALGLTPPK